MINARAETVFTKPAFRKPVRTQRALVPASGFFEWDRSREPSQPYFIGNTDGSPMLFAGIWDRWTGDGGDRLESLALLTTAAAGEISKVHDRMPVLLQVSERDVWLDSQTPEKALRDLLDSRFEPQVSLRPISRAVNSPKNDGPSLLEPLDPLFPS
jgi:putative SOS response-associated peptidase YedK